MKILVACEESQAITKELRLLGFRAYSCDLLPCSGGHPEWHFQSDVFKVIEDRGGRLQNGEYYRSKKKWDMMIAHPPCTYLAVSGAQWYYHPEDNHLPTSERRPHPRYPNRAQDREEALRFFIALAEAPIDKIAIENPIGIVSTRYRKPDQIVQPYMFGDEAQRQHVCGLKTCLKLFRLMLWVRVSGSSLKVAKANPSGIQMLSQKRKLRRSEEHFVVRLFRGWRRQWQSNGLRSNYS